MGKKNVKGDNAISVKLLTVKDSRVVRSLDFISCFSVEEWLDDTQIMPGAFLKMMN